MKIALCTSDFYTPIHESIRESGHEVKRVYTSCSLDSGFSDKTKSFADEMRAEFIFGAVQPTDFQYFAKEGVDLLISAAYDWKIPTPNGTDVKLVNVHGSLLPEGRGPWPQPWILLKHPEAAGITFHTMTDKWDFGEILLQKKIDIDAFDNSGSLIAKTLLAAKQLSLHLLQNFSSVWAAKRPMSGSGSYWKKPTAIERTIALESSVEEINKLHRAFGPFTRFQDPVTSTFHTVSALEAWHASHAHIPGSFVTASPPRRIYAVKDGYVCIIPS